MLCGRASNLKLTPDRLSIEEQTSLAMAGTSCKISHKCQNSGENVYPRCLNSQTHELISNTSYASARHTLIINTAGQQQDTYDTCCTHLPKGFSGLNRLQVTISASGFVLFPPLGFRQLSCKCILPPGRPDCHNYTFTYVALRIGPLLSSR